MFPLTPKKLNLIRLAIIVLIIAVIGGALLYLRQRPKAVVVATPVIQGRMVMAGSEPVSGTLTLKGAKYNAQLRVEEGVFTIENVTTPVSVTPLFVADNGWEYFQKGLEKRHYTLNPGKELVLEGWYPVERVVSDQLLLDKTPPVITPLFTNTVSTSSDLKLPFTVIDTTPRNIRLVNLNYRLGTTGAWKVAPLQNPTVNIRAAIIPASTFTSATTTVQYYISAEDNADNQSWHPAQGVYSPATLTVNKVALGSAFPMAQFVHPTTTNLHFSRTSLPALKVLVSDTDPANPIASVSATVTLLGQTQPVVTKTFVFGAADGYWHALLQGTTLNPGTYGVNATVTDSKRKARNITLQFIIDP